MFRILKMYKEKTVSNQPTNRPTYIVTYRIEWYTTKKRVILRGEGTNLGNQNIKNDQKT